MGGVSLAERVELGRCVELWRDGGLVVRAGQPRPGGRAWVAGFRGRALAFRCLLTASPDFGVDPDELEAAVEAAKAELV